MDTPSGKRGSTTQGRTPRPPRRKRRVVEKAVPYEVKGHEFPESGLYSQLTDFERRLDATISQKELDIREALKPPGSTSTRTLRLFVSNTYENQDLPEPGDVMDPSSTDAPTWSMRLEGRLLEDPTGMQRNRHKFSMFFSKIVVEFEKGAVPAGQNIIEWNRSIDAPDCDGFEITRIGKTETVVKIVMYPDNRPPRFRLSSDLARILGKHTDTKQHAILAFWQYIQTNNLQDRENREYFMCDDRLKRIFKDRRIPFSKIPSLISQHLGPPEPVSLEFKISLDPETPKHQEVYDVDVTVDASITDKMDTFLLLTDENKPVQFLNDKISAYIKAIKTTQQKIAFLESFAEDPKKFILTYGHSQTENAKVASEVHGLPTTFRSASTYSEPWVQDAVYSYFTSKFSQRRLELEAQNAEFTT